MNRMYISIDVFDTCLVRRCGKPEKIWDLMAGKLFEKDDCRGRLSFISARESAEKKAEVQFKQPDLKEIYSVLDVSQWGFDEEYVANLEMAMEEQELVPNLHMLNVLHELRAHGGRIYFLSDMYLPSSFVKKILLKYGFCKETEFVLVSAECRATKLGGNLFDYLFKMTSTKSNQWQHYGDNPISDFLIPKVKGVKANIVKDASFSDEEIKWLDDAKFYSHKHEIELWTGISRITRLQIAKSDEASLAVNLIASIYVPYVQFVLHESKKKGIKRLFFLSRDGFIFLRIAKILQQRSNDIDCRYLKVSRKSLYACALYEVDDYEMSLVLAKDKTVAQNLDCVGIPYHKLSETTRMSYAENFLLNSEFKLEKFKKTLQKNETGTLQALSLRNRSLFLKYLKQEDFFSDKTALVDLGWVGTCRCVMNYIFKKEGFPSVPMFYWGVNKTLKYGMIDDELFVFNRNFDFQRKYPCFNMLLEHYASMNDESTVDGYQEVEGKVFPLQGKIDNKKTSLVKLNVDAVEKFAENMKNVDSLFNAEPEVIYEIFLCCGLKQIEGILAAPSKKIAVFLGNVEIEDYGKVKKMGSFLSLKDIASLLVWGTPFSTNWTALSTKKTFGIFAPVFEFIYTRMSRSFVSKYLVSWWERKKAN